MLVWRSCLSLSADAAAELGSAAEVSSMRFVRTVPPMLPDDKRDLTLALYEAQTLSAAEAAGDILCLVGFEGAKPPASLPAPVLQELFKLLGGPLGKELALENPMGYQLLQGCPVTAG